jgi:hypothetical protein
MNLHDEDEPLEAMLSKEEPYIDDAGFTARVIERLPPRRRPATWVRSAIVLGSSVLAALLVLVYRPLGAELSRALSHLCRPDASSLSSVPLASVVLLVMLLWASVTAAQSE